MAFSPSIDFNSIMTPGGVAQGLAGVGTALLNARSMRQKAAVDAQGLERLRNQDTLRMMDQNADRQFRGDQLAETQRHNLAMEGVGQQNAAARGLAAIGGGIRSIGNGVGKFFDPKYQAELNNIVLRNRRLENPPVGEGAYGAAMKARQAALDKLDQEKLLNAADFTGAEAGWFSDAVPPRRDYARERQAILENPEWAAPITAYIKQMEAKKPGGTMPASAIPAGAGNIRQRVTAAYGGALPADVAMSVAEAEAGDIESLEQLEEILAASGAGSATPPVAPEVGPDTLGLDIGQ